MTTGKTIALTRRNFVDKIMSLLFDMLSKLVITFLLRSKHLLISNVEGTYIKDKFRASLLAQMVKKKKKINLMINSPANQVVRHISSVPSKAVLYPFM